MNVTKLFDKCINYYSHEGEFKIGNDTITIFRRCGYQDFDTNEWVEGDEAVGAFVNQEAFFGWFYQDESDLYECMEEVLEYLVNNKGLTVTLNVEASRYTEDDENKMVRKAKLINAVKNGIEVELDQIKSVKVSFDEIEDTINCKVLKFNNYQLLLEILTNQFEGANVKISESDPNKEALENMFKYRYDLL